MRNAEVHPRRRRAVAPALGLALLLGGCAAVQKGPAGAPLPAAAPQTACVDAAHIPPEPPTVGSRFNGDAKHDLQVLAPNARALREWGQQLRTLLEGCAGQAAASPAK